MSGMRPQAHKPVPTMRTRDCAARSIAAGETKLSAARILVTGFGGFPGAPKNPTAQMIADLVRYRPRLLRAGIRLELAVLPVVYGEIGPRLDTLRQKLRPDAILHFGVAPRRKRLCVETRALNRISLLHPDASGAVAADRTIVAGAPMNLQINPALRRDRGGAEAGRLRRHALDRRRRLCLQPDIVSLAPPAPGAADRLHSCSRATPRPDAGAPCACGGDRHPRARAGAAPQAPGGVKIATTDFGPARRLFRRLDDNSRI